MPEDTGQPVNPPSGEPPAQPSSEPAKLTSFIGENGELKEGWRNSFLPEDLRGEKIYDSVKDLPTAFKTLGHQAKLVGRKGILLPTEASGQSEWDAFYEATGRPKTAEDYQMPIPEEQKDYYDPELIKEAKTIFHGLGLNQKQAGALWEFEKKRVAAQEKMLNDIEEREYSEADTALHAKWGTAYNENLHLVNRMISENAEPGEEMDYLIAEYGNNPKLANFLHKVGKKFIEHRIITDIDTPSASANEKINELMRSKPYIDSLHPDHKAVVQQVQSLFAEQAKRRTQQG